MNTTPLTLEAYKAQRIAEDEKKFFLFRNNLKNGTNDAWWKQEYERYNPQSKLQATDSKTSNNKVETSKVDLPKSGWVNGIIVCGVIVGTMMFISGQPIGGIIYIMSCFFLGAMIQLLTDCRNCLKHIADKS
jgi:hypothetical protein